MGTHLGVVRLERRVKLFDLLPRVVLDHDSKRVEDHHQPGNGFFEVPSHCLLEAFDLDVGVGCGHSELVDEAQNRAGRDTTAADSNQCVQPGVVPAPYVAPIHKLHDLSLAHDGAS